MVCSRRTNHPHCKGSLIGAEWQDTQMVVVMVLLLYLQNHILQNHILQNYILQNHSDSQDLYERPTIHPRQSYNAFALYG